LRNPARPYSSEDPESVVSSNWRTERAG
jgi:hypothetical protein